MTDHSDLNSLAETFLKAAGFYHGLKAGSLANKIVWNMNSQETAEYISEVRRDFVDYAEIFSKAAVRQGLTDRLAARVKDASYDTVSALNKMEKPNFANVVAVSLQ